MTDPRTLANLVAARSEAAPEYLTFRGLIDTRPAKGYVSLLFGAGSAYGDRMAATPNVLGWSFRAMCVGYTDDQCLFVASKFRARFNGWRPIPDSAAAGWLVEARDDAPLIKNDDVIDDVRYSLTLRYLFTI